MPTVCQGCAGPVPLPPRGRPSPGAAAVAGWRCALPAAHHPVLRPAAADPDPQTFNSFEGPSSTSPIPHAMQPAQPCTQPPAPGP